MCNKTQDTSQCHFHVHEKCVRISVEMKFWALVKQMESGLFLLKADPRGASKTGRGKTDFTGSLVLGCLAVVENVIHPHCFSWLFFFISHSVFIPPVSGLFQSLSRVSLPEGPPLGEWIRYELNWFRHRREKREMSAGCRRRNKHAARLLVSRFLHFLTL